MCCGSSMPRPPTGAGCPPVVMMGAGSTCGEEESYARGRLLRERGFATLYMDMPGVGQSPVRAGRDAERQNASADLHLALEHGGPKMTRMFPGSHIGEGPVLPTVVD